MFLRKVIEHAKMFNPLLSEEAEAMITDYWSSLNILSEVSGYMS